jgi:hypothetical protein
VPESRAKARRNWPVRLQRLGHEENDDLLARTSAEERLAMVWELTVQAWALTGRPMPCYTRDETPVVRRPWPPRR